MKYVMLVRTTKSPGPPPQELFEAIERSRMESADAGEMLESGGLAPMDQGARARVENGRVRTIDGPFAESKEIIGGYAFMEFPSHSAAVASATRFMELHREHWPGWEGEVEVRQVIPCGSECPTE